MARFAGRRWLIAGLTLSVLGLALVVGSFRKRVRSVPPLAPAALTIVPGVHLLGDLSPSGSAAYVVETSEGLVLIDSGLDADAGRLRSQMAKLGLDASRLRAILLTHAHGDHSGGAEAIRKATGAKVYAGAGDATVLRAGRPRVAFFSTFHMPDQALHPTQVDVELKGGETITIGGVRFRVIATPGHTPGSLCYLLERGDLRALFAGDIIMMLRGNRTVRSELRKPLGIYSAYFAPRFRGDVDDFLASLRRLRALPVPDLVLPGHPGADPVPESPRLSQGRWEALLDDGIRDLETLSARYRRDGADFLDGVPKRLLPDLVYLGDFHGSAVYGLRACSKFFLVDAPGGPGLAEFLDARLRRLGLEPKAPTAVLLTSTGAEETAGLADLIAKCQPLVVVPAAGLQAIRERCPAGTIIIPADELPDRGWFPVRPIPLAGRGLAPVAYQVSCAGKTVLFSGRIPVKINHESGVRLFSDLMKSRDNVPDYLATLDRIRPLKPDLWLPATPTDGQNANLYDRQWEQVVDQNKMIIHSNINIFNQWARH